MNIYEKLHADHKQVKALLEELSVAESTETRRTLVEKIRDALVPHSRAEEAVLYNSLRDLDEKEIVAHSYEEHIKAETLLRALQVTEAVAIHWKSGVDKLKEALLHHIAEEEGKVFAKAKKVFSEEEATALGKAFTTLKGKMDADVLSSQAELMANLMPQRLRKSFVENMKKSRPATESKKAS